MTFFNLARVYSYTTGSGDIILSGAVPGCVAPTLTNGATYYCSVITYDPTNLRPADMESGLYTYSSSGTKLTRTTIETSSNGGSSIDLTGTSQVCFFPTAAWFNNLLPKTAVMWHDQSIKTVGNAFTTVIDAAQPYGYVTYQSAAANNDEWTNGFMIRAGTYTIKILGTTDADRGKLDVYIDGVSVSTANDFYSASTTRNVIKSISSITVTDGYHTFKGKVNGKNGSSSGYLMPLTKIWFEPSAY